MLQCCPSCKESGVESRLRFHYLALDRGVWLCPREDCTFPLGYEELDSLLVKVSKKTTGGSFSSVTASDTDDVSLCPPNGHKRESTAAGSSLPSTIESSASGTTQHTQPTPNSRYSCSYGNSTSDYTSSHGNGRYTSSHTNSRTVSMYASDHDHSSSHCSTTTGGATPGQDRCPPITLNARDSSEVDADEDIAELLGMLSPEPPTSIPW